MLSAVQWVPSRELLARSPRAEGLGRAEQTYGSWHPELLPTLLVREAYGTRALDTDWMDAFYPYHEMDVYLGALGLSLALIGAGAWRDRWVGFWVALAGLALAADLGWLAAFLAYSLGGSTVLVAFALRAAAGDRPARPQLRPAFARPGRS